LPPALRGACGGPHLGAPRAYPASQQSRPNHVNKAMQPTRSFKKKQDGKT